MTGVDAGCWTVDYGRENASPANGLAWQMWRSNTTGALPRNSVSRASAMDRRTVGYTRWGSRGLFHIKTAALITMKDGSMISVRRDVEMMNDQIIMIGVAAIVPHNSVRDSLMNEIALFVEENTAAEITDETREIR